jgi:hypothetical protein
MTSCAPRLKKDNGPTWNSVSLHWTDSDTSSFVPVDGLPWIRRTEKSKLFNKNGPLRVVAKYRNTLGVAADKASDYRHVSLIADAIEQYVLVEIAMAKEVSASPGGDWPKFRIWAFLQPPTIGNNKERNQANGGYVVDDIPRAGWFEAVVDGRSMTAEEIDYSKGHKTPAGRKTIKVTGARDATKTNVVRFKICARVANNESEAELEAKAKALRKKHQDVSLMEAGSYLKVWVRNEERTWSVNPLDDDSEKIVKSMADADRIKATRNGDPRKFCNHTWKRSRLATHKSIAGKGKDPDKALLYVGLYPAHVIEKIEKFEAKMAATSSQANLENHEISPVAWITTVIAWSLLSMGAGKLRTSVAKKREAGTPTSGENAYVHSTKQVVDLFKRAQLSDLFAGYAVEGYKNFTDIAATMEAAQVHNATWTANTKTLMDWILKFAMLSDARSKDEQALKNALEEMEKRAAGAPKKKEFKDAIPEEMVSWGRNWKDATFSVSAQLLEEKSDKKIPAVPSPLPLPGLWWLAYYLKLHAAAGLKLNLTANAANIAKGELAFRVGLEGEGELSVQIGLQGIWKALADEGIQKVGKAKPGPEAEMLQKIASVVNLEFSLMAKISPKASGELSWTFIEKKDGKFEWKFNLGSGFSCPVEFNLSVFQWSYDTFNGQIWKVNKAQAGFFLDMNGFGHPLPKLATILPWGESKYDPMCYTLPNSKDRDLMVAFGMAIPLHLLYSQAVNPQNCTASLSINVGGSDLEIASKIPVDHHPPANEKASGEVLAPLQLTWSPAAKPGPGIIALHSLHALKWDKLQKILAGVASGEHAMKAMMTTPEEEEKSLSDKSSIKLLRPKARDSAFMTTNHPKAGLWFQYDFDFYADRYIWIKLCEDDLLVDDVCGLKGSGKNNWRLYPLLGSPALHSTRQVFLPATDILSISDAESSYQFYLKLALLDDDSCQISLDSKMRLNISASALATLRKG